MGHGDLLRTKRDESSVMVPGGSPSSTPTQAAMDAEMDDRL